MTLGNMRANGVRSLSVSCCRCHHQADLDVERYADDVPVPAFGPRMVCTACGTIGADARPNWKEYGPATANPAAKWGMMPLTSNGRKPMGRP